MGKSAELNQQSNFGAFKASAPAPDAAWRGTPPRGAPPQCVKVSLPLPINTPPRPLSGPRPRPSQAPPLPRPQPPFPTPRPCELRSLGEVPRPCRCWLRACPACGPGLSPHGPPTGHQWAHATPQGRAWGTVASRGCGVNGWMGGQTDGRGAASGKIQLLPGTQERGQAPPHVINIYPRFSRLSAR